MLAIAGGEIDSTEVVHADWWDAFGPLTDAPPIRCNTPILRGADRLRRSLIPSLLDARRLNESLGNPVIELFEIAKDGEYLALIAPDGQIAYEYAPEFPPQETDIAYGLADPRIRY